MAEDENEAKLHLRLLQAENLKPIRFLGKMKTFIIAWIDPRFKKSTNTLTTSTTNPNFNSNLSFPISTQTLQNPSSSITIQILSFSPVQRERVIGTVVLPLGDVREEEKVFALQVWRPSGRAFGLLRVSARVECYLRFCTIECVTGIPIGANLVEAAGPLDEMVTGVSGGCNVVPSAPPEEESDSVELEKVREEMGSSDMVEMSLDPLSVARKDRVECGSRSVGLLVSEGRDKTEGGSNVLRSFLVGLVGGAVAVATVLVGSNAG